MGYGSGALFTTAVPKVTFLARTREKAEQGLAAAVKQVRSPTVADRVECGSYDEDFERAVANADLVFEAVTEKLELKEQFFERVDAASAARIRSWRRSRRAFRSTVWRRAAASRSAATSWGCISSTPPM